MSLYGKPTIHVGGDTTDLIGIRTLVLWQLWQPSRSNLSQEQLDAEKPGIPGVPGGLLLVESDTRQAGGAMRTSWKFEGINGDGKSPTFKDRTRSLDYEFHQGFAQIPIEKHPNYQQLLDTYGGTIVDGQTVWPPTIAAGGSLSAGKGKSIPNPMFPESEYFASEGGVYSFRYAATDIGGIQNGVGKIHPTSALPGRPPSVTEGRNWLKVDPVYRRRGLIFEIVELYWVSRPGGWKKPIYGQIGGGVATGLTTGTLTTGSLS